MNATGGSGHSLELTPKELRLAVAADRRKTAEGWLGFVLAMMLLAAAAILGWQCLMWLKDGTWTSLSWSDAFQWLGDGHRQIRWIGLRKIVHLIGQLPLCLLPFCAAIGAGLWSQSIIDNGRDEHGERRAVLKRAEIAKRQREGVRASSEPLGMIRRADQGATW